METQSSQLAYAEPHRGAPLRVLFDGRKLGDGGIGVYIENTVRGLLARRDVDLTLIATQKQSEMVPWRQDVSWVFDAARSYSLSEYLLLARRVDFTAYDLFHSPHYTLPFGIRIPSVVTIHDLIHIEYPERAYYPFVARRLIRSAMKRASVVLAVSEDTRRSLERLIGVERVRVEVVPNAVPEWMLAGRATQAAGIDVTAITGTAPYFMAVVSNLKPHKGLDRLLQAYALMRARISLEGAQVTCPRLLLVGHGAELLLEQRNRFSDLQLDEVAVVGAVKPDELRSLYRRADAVVVASQAEGFCFPALEAQSVGTRVVCTPLPAVREFVTQRDLVARDFSSEAMAEVLCQAALAPSGDRSVDVRHLERFSLDRVTEQICDVYHQVASTNRSKARRVQ